MKYPIKYPSNSISYNVASDVLYLLNVKNWLYFAFVQTSVSLLIKDEVRISKNCSKLFVCPS